MVGRDIGTVVLPSAAKVYLSASPAERARRRHAELEGAKRARAQIVDLFNRVGRAPLSDAQRRDYVRAVSDYVTRPLPSLKWQRVAIRVLRAVLLFERDPAVVVEARSSLRKAILFAGVNNVVSVLKEVGFTTLDNPLGYGPALTLGGADITLEDIVFANSVLANGGIMRGQDVLTAFDPGERTLEPVALLRVTDADGETLLGYLSRPTLPGPHPAILIVHENRGLLPHFHDITRRYAREGYVALAIDMLSRQGGADSFADGNDMRAALSRIPQDQVVYDGNAAVKYLQSLPYVRDDRVGATGFCFGGSIVWQMAVGNPELRAAVPFYGSAPSLDDVAGMQVPVLGIYAGEDSRINTGVPALEAALIAQNKEYKFVTYPGANHAFFNDTGSRYHPQAAESAWMEALDWFEDHLMDT